MNYSRQSWRGALRFLLPTGVGNVIGGTAIFTLLIYNQVRMELHSNGTRANK